MYMGPKNGIMGNDGGFELPIMEVPQEDLDAERKSARFSKTAEYKRLKAYLEARMDYYQKFLPDGTAVVGADPAKLGTHWQVANAIIAEFKAVMSYYETAQEAVKDADTRTNGVL